MGKTSRPNALNRQNDNRKFPALSSTSSDIRCRELNAAEKVQLAEMLGQVLPPTQKELIENVKTAAAMTMRAR
jgi:hypothetical protein